MKHKPTFNSSIVEESIIVCPLKRFHSKQLEYVTKGHITMPTHYITIITLSHLIIAQTSSSFKHLDMYHVTPTFITEALRTISYVKSF